MMGLTTTFQAQTLLELLSYRASTQPKQIAYTFLRDGETDAIHYTYQQLEHQVKVIAAHLQSCYQPGNRILLLYPPGLDYISAFFGCLYAGMVAVPAYPPRPNRLSRLQGILQDAGAEVALTNQQTLGGLQRQIAQLPELQSLKLIATDTLADHLAQHWQEPTINSDTLAFLQYTSGSTATPKGVMISHGNLLHNLRLIYQCFGHSSTSQGVIWLPPYHDMGLIGGVLQPLYGGFPVVLMSPLIFLQSPLRWLQAISRYKGTTSGGPNFAFDLCVRKITPEQKQTLDLSSWEVAFNGAEPISADILDQFAEAFEPCGFRREAFYPCYGMAESTLIISGGAKTAAPIFKTVQAIALEKNRVVPGFRYAENTHTLVSCGQPLPDGKIVIVHPETLSACQPGEVGEIWVSGPSIAQGYWGKNQETEETFKAYLASGEGPFLRTGDLGFLDRGELFVTGRLKDVIIINGRNHYPQDIEWTVEQSHPLIRPSCSAGFSVDIAGEEKLVVVAEVERHSWERRHQLHERNGTTKGRFPKEELIQSIRRAIFKHHDLQVHTTLLLKPGTIPKTSSGKIQRHACRAGFLAGTLDVVDG